MRDFVRRPRAVVCALAVTVLGGSPALAQSLAMTDHRGFPSSIFDQILPDRSSARMPEYAVAPPADESLAEVPAHLRRQTVAYNTREAPGTIVIDTANTYLYYVLGGGRAIRYGIGVGREGFTWAGVRAVNRKQEWPDWHPPAEMIQRQPYLPRFMAGGPGNPLGARAMYIGGTLYRIHGTNQPSSIGQKVSSGCIRLLNEDVIDLYSRVNIGTKVVVLPDGPRAPANVASTRPEAMEAYASYPGPLPATVRAPRPVAPAYIGASSHYRYGGSASRLY
jgi:lipoprotein-anchoring transpeptidase ErfK/SrfK